MAVLSENQESGVRGQESAAPVVSTSAAAPANTPFKIQLADRLTKLPPYVLARVNALRDQKRKAGQDVIDLGMGNPSEPPQEIVIEKLMEAAQDPDNHGYSKANGILNLRREVAALAFLACSSSCIAPTSDLRIRSERPTLRAASGSRLAPNSRMNAAMMINQCHQDRPPMLIFLPLSHTTVRPRG